jgi:putative holliday junction resolvase
MTLTPRGRRLAIDVGSVRIGVASCDPDGILATPVETVARTPKADGDLRRIAAIVEEYEAVEVIVGLPKTLRDEHGHAAALATEFGDALGARISPVPVLYSDERLSTITAQQALRSSGVRAKAQKGVVDQAAAVAILQGWLDLQTHRHDLESGRQEGLG